MKTIKDLKNFMKNKKKITRKDYNLGEAKE